MSSDVAFRTKAQDVMVQQLEWLDRFFSVFETRPAANVLTVVEGIEIALDRVTLLADSRRGGLSGWSTGCPT